MILKFTRPLILLSLFYFISFNVVIAQPWNEDSSNVISRLKADVYLLASDSLEGREAGTKGEHMAAAYIESKFKEIGLIPVMPENSYLQSFEFTDGVTYGVNNYLVINKKKFSMPADFYPLVYSANGKISGSLIKVGYGIVSKSENYDDYKGKTDLKDKIFVMELSSPDGMGQGSKFQSVANITSKIELAIEKGAKGIIFINSDKNFGDPSAELSKKISTYNLPVIFATQRAYKLLMDGTKWDGQLSVDLQKEKRTGKNVMGFIDNKAPTTIIIGAHYDHLGFGGESSRCYGCKAVHNGADDNASGVSSMIELARHFKQAPSKNNYLFIAFTGEEKGLLGSNSAANSTYVDLSKVNYMLNLDMVGRLKNDEKSLGIFGVGTSPIWKKKIENISYAGIQTKTVDSGVGSSDHTSFYLKNVPVLHFFTDLHDDYHTPDDDADKINFPGLRLVTNYVIKLVESIDAEGKIEFTNTNDVSSLRGSRFSVSLGVVPDHLYTIGDGLRIQGVTTGKPGFYAGLKANDIIQKIGENDITEINTYMNALGKFKKGDKSQLKVKRGSEILYFDVQF